jgi:hypothetical protein
MGVLRGSNADNRSRKGAFLPRLVLGLGFPEVSAVCLFAGTGIPPAQGRQSPHIQNDWGGAKRVYDSSINRHMAGNPFRLLRRQGLIPFPS